LQLAPGHGVIALVKSSYVLLAHLDDATRFSVQNRLEGIVLGRVDGCVNTRDRN
jgi:molybdopterin-binding protein